MGEPGETDAYGSAGAVRHAPSLAIDDGLVNVTPIPDAPIRRFAAAGARPIAEDREALIALGRRPVERDPRHDAGTLARAVVDPAPEGAAR